MVRSHVSPLLLVGLAFFVTGCLRQTPVVAPGGVGVFARYIPPDPGTPNLPADARSGELAQGDLTWPPTPLATDCTPGRHEIGDFEKAFGVRSDACPALQLAPVPSVTTTDAADAGPPLPHPLGHNRYCFVQGAALIVIETTEHLGSCEHVVGVAVYPKAGK